MPRPAEARADEATEEEGPGLVERFTRGERYVHWATAAVMLTLIATGAILYLPELANMVGHRNIVSLTHLYVGLSLPIPMAAGLFSRAYRADLARINRHTRDDRTWLRERAWKAGRARHLGLKVGKFNAGQKLNAAFMAGAILVMAGTGVLMGLPHLGFPHLLAVRYRTGATFVHDWLALAIGFVVLGHLWFAANDAQARRGMRHGSVARWWVEDEHGEWAEELTAAKTEPAAAATRTDAAKADAADRSA